MLFFFLISFFSLLLALFYFIHLFLLRPDNDLLFIFFLFTALDHLLIARERLTTSIKVFFCFRPESYSFPFHAGTKVNLGKYEVFRKLFSKTLKNRLGFRPHFKRRNQWKFRNSVDFGLIEKIVNMEPYARLRWTLFFTTLITTFCYAHEPHHQPHHHHHHQRHHEGRQRLLADAASSMPSWVKSSEDLQTTVEGVFEGVVDVDADDEGAPGQRFVKLTPNMVAYASEGTCTRNEGRA